jgi:hypothetical protein
VIFHQNFVIESSLPQQEAWKNLLPVVKTDLPGCAQCGQSLAGATRFCSHCGQPVPPPIPRSWAQRYFSSGGFQFEGDVSQQGFNITRIISYRNSCIPVIRGRFEPSPTGTRIVVEMNMHPLGYVFLVGGAGISFFVLSVVSVDGNPAAAIGALAAPCFIALVCWVAFTTEANTARAALSQLWPPGAQL